MDIRGDQLDWYDTVLIHAVVVSVMGGFVSWLRRKSPRKWGQLFVSAVTAGFIGLLTHYIASWLELNIHLQFVLSGIAGYGGGSLLDDAVESLRHFITTTKTGGVK